MATPAEKLAAELSELRRRVTAMERGSQLSNSSIEVDGEDVPVPDALSGGVVANREVPGLKQGLDAASDELVEQKRRLDEDIPALIDDAAASPVTDARLSAGSLTVWPFQAGTVPTGALAEGAVGEAEIADFSLVARKFRDDRHRIY